jgi:tetratricopeptide (TPR) repeat protein
MLSPSCIADLGRTAQALDEVGPAADRIQSMGDVKFIVPRALQLRLLVELGTPEDAPSLDGLLAAVRDAGQPEVMAIAFATAARLLLAQGQPKQAGALLQELDRLVPRRTELAWALPSLVRVALSLDELPLAERFAEGVEPVNPGHENALASAQAQLAEAAGRRADAARLYGGAAERWRKFGNVPERAYALLGQGRCLLELGDAGAEEPLVEARNLFGSMGYRPALAETENLLAESVTKTA